MEMHSTLTLLVPLVDLAIAGIENIPVVKCAGIQAYRQDTPYVWLARTREGRGYAYTPCLDWRLGGPLIQKHEVSFRKENERWFADIRGKHCTQGKTPLIACMRAVVHKHFGDTVALTVPAEQATP